jgi:hypothetical protein
VAPSPDRGANGEQTSFDICAKVDPHSKASGRVHVEPQGTVGTVGWAEATGVGTAFDTRVGHSNNSNHTHISYFGAPQHSFV